MPFRAKIQEKNLIFRAKQDTFRFLFLFEGKEIGEEKKDFLFSFCPLSLEGGKEREKNKEEGFYSFFLSCSLFLKQKRREKGEERKRG